MHFLENFIELCFHQNLISLNKLFESDKLSIENFEKHVNLKDMQENEIEKLDFFIEKCLKIYPQFYRFILHKETNNRIRSHKTSSKQLNEKVMGLLSNNSFFEAIELLSNEAFIDSIDNEDLNSKKELANIHNEIVDLSQTEVIVKNVIKEIKVELIEAFDDILTDHEKTYLSYLIGYEILLRCKLPEEYVITENTNDIYDIVEDIKMLNKKQARKILIEEVAKNTSPEKILKILKAKIIPF